MVWFLYNSDCTIQSYTAYQVRKEGFENCSLLNLGRGALMWLTCWVLCGLRARLSLVEVYKARKSLLCLCQSWPALPSCHVECPLSTIWHSEPQFGGITRILMQKCQAPSNGPFRIKSKFALPLFHSNYIINGKKRQKIGGTKELEN